jgi:hypothetical protein
MRRLGLCALIVLWATGCDLLFPELTRKPDMAMSDGAVSGDGGTGGPPRIAGRVCALGDLRDYRTCAPANAAFRIAVEETRDATMSDVLGVFALPLSKKLDTAIVAVVDPTGRHATSIVPLRLRDGVLDPIAVPVVLTAARDQAAFALGIPLDPARGALLAWATDDMGRPLAGVQIKKPGGMGPYTSGAGQNELEPGPATRTLGLVALFDLPAGTANLQLTPPPPLKADLFALPVRGNALTLTTLVQR